MFRHFLILFALVGTLNADTSPNTLLILADDLGIGDLGCYRSDSGIPTPNLDKLAREGMRFTDAYCPVSVCTPTRYALMTGEYPWRSWKSRGVLANWERPLIAPVTLTLPGMLQSAGYDTAGYGKWHLGAHYTTTDGKTPLGVGKFKSDNSGANLDISVPLSGGPLDRGFNTWSGFICASEQLIFEGNEAAAVLGHDLYTPPPAKGVDKLPVIPLNRALARDTRSSIAYLNSRQGKETPFFLYFSPYVPHIPLAVSEPFQGITQAGEYGDYVHELDHHIGLLLEALDRNELAENTLVIFASDNGSQFQETGTAEHAPNAPYSGTKWTIREGGVRTPLIIRWPGMIRPGSVSNQLIALLDLLPTLAAIIDQSLPEGAAQDGLNMLPVLLETTSKPIRQQVALQSSGGLYGFRSGQWKFIDGSGDRNRDTGANYSPQLYDLRVDPGERYNIAAQHPALVQQLKADLDALR